MLNIDDIFVWYKFGINLQWNSNPPVVTTFPEIKIFRSLLLRQLAVDSGSRFFAEVGTARGLQSITWANWLYKNKYPGIVFTCDIIGMDDKRFKTPLHGDTCVSRRMLWEDEASVDKVRFVHGTSSVLSDSIDASIDMLYIDGQHDYNSVKEDFSNLSCKLSSKALLIFDDYDERFPGVVRAVDEIASGRTIHKIYFHPDKYTIAVIEY